MAGDYYPDRANAAGISRVAYNQVLWFVRSYDDMTSRLADLVQQSGEKDGQPRSKEPGDPVGETAARREKLAADIKIIDNALLLVPEYYRAIIFENVKDRRPLYSFPEYHNANKGTWTYWRIVFIRYVALMKGWI